MPSLAQKTALAAALVALTGCHARYRKMAPTIGSVRPAVANPGAPSLELGEAATPELTGNVVVDVVDAAVAVGTISQAPKAAGVLRRAISPEEVAAGLERSLMTSPMEGALPHKIGPKGKHVMLVTVNDYGVDVSGGAPVFYTSVSVRIDRKRDGKRVYRASTTCTEPLSSMPDIPLETAQKFQALQGLSEVAALTPEELNAVAMAGIDRCGQRIVERMVRHSS